MQCRCMCRAMCRETALSQIDAEPLCFCPQKRGNFCGFCRGLLRADHLPMPAAGVGRAQAGARGGGAGAREHVAETAGETAVPSRPRPLASGGCSRACPCLMGTCTSGSPCLSSPAALYSDPLRAEQDREYEESLMADQLRELQAQKHQNADGQVEPGMPSGTGKELTGDVDVGGGRRGDQQVSPAVLGAEPEAGDGVVSLRFRLPSGRTHERRFLLLDGLQVHILCARVCARA